DADGNGFCGPEWGWLELIAAGTSSAIHTEPMQPCCVGFLFACYLPLLIALNTLVFFNILLIFPPAGSIITRKSPINLRRSELLRTSQPTFLFPKPQRQHAATTTPACWYRQ
ncbi:hypothetical protein ACET94_22220, partial [Aeromonas veronii]